MYVDTRGIIYDDLTDERISQVSEFEIFFFIGKSKQDIIQTLVDIYKRKNYTIDINIIKDIANKCEIVKNAEFDNIKSLDDNFFKNKKKPIVKQNKQDSEDKPQLSLF